MKKVLIGLCVLLVAASVMCVARALQEEQTSVRIGVLAPLTGVRSDAGEYMRNALLIAQEEINADEHADHSIDFVFEDTQYKASVAVSGAQKLIELDSVEYGGWCK